MESFSHSNLDLLSRVVEDAVVFLDDPTSEYLHWCNGFKKLFEAGALDIRDLKHTKVF